MLYDETIFSSSLICYLVHNDFLFLSQMLQKVFFLFGLIVLKSDRYFKPASLGHSFVN